MHVGWWWLQNVEAGTQVDDSQVESAVARKSSRGAWLLGDDDDHLNVSHQHKLLAAVSSEALPTSLTDALRKDPQVSHTTGSTAILVFLSVSVSVSV